MKTAFAKSDKRVACASPSSGKRRAWKHAFLRIVIIASATMWAAMAHPAPSVTWLGTLGGRGSEAWGVSADGRVVVGRSTNALGFTRAFRWEAGVMQELGTLGGSRSFAWDVSADGRVVVGQAQDSSGYYWPVAWVDGQTILLSSPDFLGGSANAVSADGMTIVGWIQRRMDTGGVAYLWVKFRPGPALYDPGYYSMEATGISLDGQVIVGKSTVGEMGRALKWSPNGYEELPTLGGRTALAEGVSADGTVVVGSSLPAQGNMHPCRWVGAQVQNLGTLGGSFGFAHAVSGDGRTVVGSSGHPSFDRRAFRWTPERGMEDLTSLYVDPANPNAYFRVATGISLDARYIVGYGRLPSLESRGFLIDTHQQP
ncbi:hypothetical protein FCG40_09090 [Fimbriimonadia bacterium ATM]|nr:MAG: hypothetical protein EDM73_06140 [Armatimonadota bacterium]MBC6968893.1 hypothetical protein [Armatimonadota bacterium]MCE7900022.1 hypothetical protein [Armatimonadetes bacterium ATM1]MDL1929130.1 hypothetical protein [Fimbriimonadia bacterium ATM]RIJ96817.1 MAG: hypothetical protein DCC45_05480 [Armatimonadota bacterium]